jgi:AcrR family transcriptional regulator
MAPTSDPAVGTADDTVAGRILDGALVCVGRVGLAKTTFDDVAKEAGSSRATVYRYFAGRNVLLEALVEREVGRLEIAVRAAVATATSLDEALTRAAVVAVEHLESIDALRFLLEHEPETVMPYLALDRANHAFAAGSAMAVELFEPWLDAPAAARAGEWLARLVTAYIVSLDTFDVVPSTLADPEAVRSLVADFVVPGLASISTQKR